MVGGTSDLPNLLIITLGAVDRGVKRGFGERDQVQGATSLGFRGQEGRKENVAPAGGPGAVPLALPALQTAATAIVAKGQIIPVLPGSALFHAIQVCKPSPVAPPHHLSSRAESKV